MSVIDTQGRPASVITTEMQREFREVGIVHLRNVLEPTWLQLIETGINRNLHVKGPYQKLHFEGTPREFYDDYCNYWNIPEYRMLMRDSPLVELIAELMRTKELRMLYEQIFLKQGGLSRRTPWHQDMTYFPAAGRQVCAAWITLDPVNASQSLEFVRSSHNGPLYAGMTWDPNDETTPFYADWERLPDIEADRDSYDIVSFDTEPGDVLVFHPSILHGGGASEGQRRALSIRFFGDDVVYEERPGGRSAPPFPGLEATCKPGAPLRSSWFPLLYPRTGAVI